MCYLSNPSGPYCSPLWFAVSPLLKTTSGRSLLEHEATQTDLIEPFPTHQSVAINDSANLSQENRIPKLKPTRALPAVRYSEFDLSRRDFR